MTFLSDRMMHALFQRSVDATSTCPNAGLNIPLSAIMLLAALKCRIVSTATTFA
jgi:hypothetical protein